MQLISPLLPWRVQGLDLIREETRKATRGSLAVLSLKQPGVPLHSSLGLSSEKSISSGVVPKRSTTLQTVLMEVSGQPPCRSSPHQSLPGSP